VLLLLILVTASKLARCLRARPSLFHLLLHLLILLVLLLVLLGNVSGRDRHARGLWATWHHTLLLLDLHAVLILRHFVSAGSTLHLLALELVLIVVVHVGLHLITVVAIVDEYAAHVHSKASISSKSGHATCHLLLLQVQALNLNQILHLLLLGCVGELSLELLHRLHGLVGLLHLELHIVENAIKVYRIQLDWNFDSRVLLEVH